jgi:GT2 family glycosyltransferase/glycosyltransferase involved in cell wall biosynthesis
MAALQRGQEALAGGNFAAALSWLERATRLAADDPAPLLTLAAARLAGGDPALAARDFAEVARRCDVREAWLGRAVACLRLGLIGEAVQALQACLSRHRWEAGSAAVASAVAEAAGRPGWCAMAADETIAVGLVTRTDAAVRITTETGTIMPQGTVPAGVLRVRVTVDGADLLGSPIEPAVIRRLEGIVAAGAAGLEGWAWHPGDAARDPVLRFSDGVHTLRMAAVDQTARAVRPLLQARRFSVSRADLAHFSGRIAVTGPNGVALAGSPLDPEAAARAAGEAAPVVARAWPFGPAPESMRGTKARSGASAGPVSHRPAAVVVPVYNGRSETLACLRALRRSVSAETALVVVDDCSSDRLLAADLDCLAARGAIQLVRLERNRGFPGAANAGMRAAHGLDGAPDVVLLNSDTLPTAGWLERLRAAVHAAPDIGTATPLSNDATILSYPDPAAPAAPPSGAALAQLARAAARANPDAIMYIRRECLQQVGVFREDLFAQGYGEENDFCLRARQFGWRHVAVPGAYVAHLGGRSFAAARNALIARNLDVLEQVHPGYHTLIADFAARDPLLPARRRLDALRWCASLRGSSAGAVLLVTHDSGGGVERCIGDRCRAIREAGRLPILLRPVLDRSGNIAALERSYVPGYCQVDGDAAHWPNLRYRVADELDELADLLGAARPVAMEVHHLLGHHHGVLDLARRLGVLYDLRLHDYACFCPRVSLVGRSGQYCGEPEVAECEACIAELGSRLEEPISVPDLLARSSAELAGAARVIAPSADAAGRLQRHFPAIRADVEPHEADCYPRPEPVLRSPQRLVCVVGAIGQEKGFDILLECARDAAARDLRLGFVVVGHSVDDEKLLDTGRVTITGPFQAAEAEPLIRAQGATLGFLPSVWPETWCLALGEAWRAGLSVAAFDLGAPAERIRATGRGWLLPLGMPPSSINNAFLTFAPLAGD